MKFKKIFFLLISLVLIIGLTFMVLKQPKLKSIFYSSYGVNIPAEIKILGIDVSHHQGKINWKQVENMQIKGNSVQFVYLKVTEGTWFKDHKYNYNRKVLDKMPVKVGVYHFFSPKSNITKQVSHFTNSFKRTTLKPVLDVETIGDLSKNDLIQKVTQFLNETEKRINVRPIIYTYESFYKDYIKGSSLEKEKFWIANYNKTCAVCKQSNVIAWQFSEKGTVNGIAEKVDLNMAKDNFWQHIIW